MICDYTKVARAAGIDQVGEEDELLRAIKMIRHERDHLEKSRNQLLQFHRAVSRALCRVEDGCSDNDLLQELHLLILFRNNVKELLLASNEPSDRAALTELARILKSR
jgi:hypothetical protein